MSGVTKRAVRRPAAGHTAIGRLGALAARFPILATLPWLIIASLLAVFSVDLSIARTPWWPRGVALVALRTARILTVTIGQAAAFLAPTVALHLAERRRATIPQGFTQFSALDIAPPGAATVAVATAVEDGVVQFADLWLRALATGTARR